MPAYVHKLYPEAEAQFDEWVLPEETKVTTLCLPDRAVGKLVLVHCLPSNAYSVVFEHVIPAKAAHNEDDELDEFIREALESDPVARLGIGGFHPAAIGDGEGGILGLAIRHLRDYEPNRITAARFESFLEQLRQVGLRPLDDTQA